MNSTVPSNTCILHAHWQKQTVTERVEQHRSDYTTQLSVCFKRNLNTILTTPTFSNLKMCFKSSSTDTDHYRNAENVHRISHVFQIYKEMHTFHIAQRVINITQQFPKGVIMMNRSRHTWLKQPTPGCLKPLHCKSRA